MKLTISRRFQIVLLKMCLHTYTAPQLGDEVLGYGLGHTAKVWTGVIADINLNGNNHNRPEACKILG